MKKTSIAVAMSGGVDSSVTAALLKRAGHRVEGFSLKLPDFTSDGPTGTDPRIANAVQEAGRVCEMLGIPHHELDVGAEFRQLVVDPFINEYLAGRTPNPCVGCNALIKWGLLWDKAREMGLERFATGHYARVEIAQNNDVRLLKGLDPHKEQSYFLWQIPIELLRLTILPLGEMTKSEVRTIARELDLPVADRGESQEICFIPGDDYRSWLEKIHPDVDVNARVGEMVDRSGRVLSLHSGCHFFTIGQRKGLGLGGGKKLYVTAIDPKTHRVQVGSESELERSEFRVGSVRSLSPMLYNVDIDIIVKIRYHDPGVYATVERLGEDRLIVRTRDPVKAVAPGQSAVFYHGDQVVGGGVILHD